MKVALIAPKNLLELSTLGDIHFVVPQNCDISFFRKETKYKMLDNGSYETGKSLDIEALIELAKSISANEIVLPDKIRDMEQTVELTLEAISYKRRWLKLAAVPQGHNPSTFVECYRLFSKIDEIDVLCFPVWLEKAFHARPHVVHYILKKGFWAENKEHHLIGLDRLSELLCYPYGMIRSVDTSLPFSAAKKTFYLSTLGVFSGKRVNLSGDNVDLSCLKFNVKKLKGIALLV